MRSPRLPPELVVPLNSVSAATDVYAMTSSTCEHLVLRRTRQQWVCRHCGRQVAR